MGEIVEKEWLERSRWNQGKPIGFRLYKTKFEANMAMEEVILKIALPMDRRNKEKTDNLDQGIFYKEQLEEVFLGSDDFWRYTVSMGYIKADNDIRKKNQLERQEKAKKIKEKKEQKRLIGETNSQA